MSSYNHVIFEDVYIWHKIFLKWMPIQQKTLYNDSCTTFRISYQEKRKMANKTQLRLG